MALVTYVFLVGLNSGLQSHFNPGLATLTALGVVLAEFALIKGGCYFLPVGGQGQVLNFMAYGGYKFVGYALVFLHF